MIAAVGYKAVVGDNGMGGFIIWNSHTLYVWPGVGASATSYPTPMASDGTEGELLGSVDYVVADRFGRLLLAEKDSMELTNPSLPADTAWGISRCTLEFKGYSENGRGGSESPFQHAAAATPEGDLMVLNWNSIRLLGMDETGACEATSAGIDYHYAYAPTLYFTRQVEGDWQGTSMVNSDFMRDMNLNVQGDPTPDWFKLALLDMAVDTDGTIFVLANLRREWTPSSGAVPSRFTGLFRLDSTAADGLVPVQMLSAASARFLRRPDGGLAVGTDERHLLFLANGEADSMGYGPTGLDGRAVLMMSNDTVGVFQASDGPDGGQFVTYAVQDLGSAPEGELVLTPAVGPTPLEVLAEADYVAGGTPLDEAFWYVDSVADGSLPQDLPANPTGVPISIDQPGSHLIGARVAPPGEAEPPSDTAMTPPSRHAAALELVEGVEPVNGTWMERFHVQPFHQVSAFGVLMNRSGVYEVEPPATLHIYGRGPSGTLVGSSTWVPGVPPWGPPPPASSTELHGIGLDGDRLVVNLWSGGGIGFVVLDVSNGIDYEDLGTITVFPPQPNFYPMCRNFDVKNGFLAAGGDYRFHMADVNQMQALGTYDMTPWNMDIMRVAILDNGFVAVMADTRMAIIDPGLGGEGHGQVFGITGWVNQIPGNTMIGAAGNRVAFTTNGDVVWVDCSDPANPLVEAPLEIPGLAWTGGACSISEGTLWCSNGVGPAETRVPTLDVYDPVSGELLGRYLEYRPTGTGLFAVSEGTEAVIGLSQTEARIVEWHR